MKLHKRSEGVFQVCPTKKYKCETCHDTGWYGDNGPGIKGNNEYQRCECMAETKVKICPMCDGRGVLYPEEIEEEIWIKRYSKKHMKQLMNGE